MSFVPENTTNPYKDRQGRYLTLGLFKETKTSEVVPYVYTFEQAKKMYLDMADPTEYLFAMSFLNSWEHWQILSDCAWFQETLEGWRKELGLKLHAIGIQKMVEAAQGSGREAAAAAKWLAEEGWKPKESSRGRPSKGDVERAARTAAYDRSRVEDHFQSISKKQSN